MKAVGCKTSFSFLSKHKLKKLAAKSIQQETMRFQICCTFLVLLVPKFAKSGQEDWRQIAESIRFQVSKRFGNQYEKVEDNKLQLNDANKLLELTNYRTVPALSCNPNIQASQEDAKVFQDLPMQNDSKYSEKVKKVGNSK